MIALVDFGAGNLTSVRKALAHLGADVWTPSVPGELARATAIIVPGVGHFDATRGLTEDWRAAILMSIDHGVPLLGICVGLQWLFGGSTEAPGVPGLGIFKGTCFHFAEKEIGSIVHADERKIDPIAFPALKVPHVGWNSLSLPRPSRLMAGVAEGTQVYFTHSYAAPIVDDTVAACDYGVPFSAAVERANVAAVQFHPEKSGDAGLRVLSNWVACA